ncbi:MAG: Ppx/GppA family phosphatase [Gammaproteobacteria bacterium]|nr:Ppx/GppA family phosphatase [Gammaproteobacteria bacterium]
MSASLKHSLTLQNNEFDASVAESDASSFAAIDLGSNSFHMVVATPEGDSIRIIDSLRVPVRLGSGLDKHKRITPTTEKNALQAIGQFAQRLRGIPARNIRVVGTNTLRRARNSDRFLNDAFLVLRKRIEIISGREEARLIYSAVAHGLPEPEHRRLVIDIGGGSTELITGQGYKPELMESTNMGCVSFTHRFFSSDKINAAAFKAAIVAAELELQPIAKSYRDSKWDEVIGCSGTIKAASAVLQEVGLTDGVVQRQALRKLQKLIIQNGSVEKLKLDSISKDRLQVFAAGIAVLFAVMKTLGIDELRASQVALREGLIFELIGQAEHTDIQTQTITNLITRFHVDELHTHRVKQLALQLFEQAAEPWELGEESNLLAWAAELHEIGLSVAHTQYHKHGAYLIQHSDLLGFSNSEQTALALLIRYHRRKLDISAFDELPADERNRLLRMLVLLRLAVLLLRARYVENLDTLKFKFKSDQINVIGLRSWFSNNPLTDADLANERTHLEPTGITLKVLRTD